ncbi:hypothetical protein LUX57_29450 [Actinomadura madurae]|uniref:hypothetical protein n=1 Tax=Actinomadura madurae TaxID=1993 RepID=UPI0020D20D9F|nr:hypothetical protein [Actinomadura madurae]MCP9968787.1 hypothetical protein [Actinomadura madurae]
MPSSILIIASWNGWRTTATIVRARTSRTTSPRPSPAAVRHAAPNSSGPHAPAHTSVSSQSAAAYTGK